MLMSLWQSFLNMVYPPRCPICRGGVTTHGAWCPTCFHAVWKPRRISLAGHGVTSLDSCWALCDYTGGVQRLIRDMKFRAVQRYGTHISWLVSQAPVDKLGRIDAIVPVPLSPERLAARGFNQTELMFRRWAKQRGYLWLEALERKKATLPQWELTLKERRANIKGAFTLARQADIAGKHILLVDDIFTTGLTMDECAKVLKRAGAVRVTGLAIATGAG